MSKIKETESMNNKAINKKKLIGGILGFVVFIIVGWMLPCPKVLHEAVAAIEQTDHNAMIALGSLLFAIIWWVCGVAADWVTALLMVTSWPLLGVVDIPTAYAPFANTTIWLVIGGFSIAGAVTKTGLLRRIAFNLMKIFPASFGGQSMALMVAGTVCSPLIPSSTAKAVLGGSIANASSDAMGYEHNSKGRAGLFLASWYGFGVSVPAFISASAFGYIVKGFMPEEIQEQITWGGWFVAMIPWLIVFLVLMYLGNLFMYKPKNSEKMSKEYINEELAKMGKMGKQEIITAVVLVLCLIFWIFEKQSGINATTTAVVGMLICFVSGTLSPKDIGTRVPWGLVIFIGSVLSLGNRFADCGLSDYINSLFAPIFSSMPNIFIAILVMFIIVYIVRIFVAAQAVVISMFLGIMMPVMTEMGMNPFVLGLLIYTAVNTFFVLFQNPIYAAGFGAMDGTIEQKNCMNGAILYAVVALICAMVCIPYWYLIGYIG